jgi:hypothetical protein
MHFNFFGLISPPPRFWPFTLEFCNGLHESFFRIRELDHVTHVGLATEKERVDEFAGSDD